jgi:biopolymer transport protein ExbB/TolQ
MSRGRQAPDLTIQLLIALVLLGIVFAIIRLLLPVLILAGVSALAWWLWKRYQGKRLLAQQIELHQQNELKAAFYQLLQQNNGRIKLIDFAFKTNLLGKEAKQYLDERAKEFSAAFEVDDQGNVVYCFGMPNQLNSPDRQTHNDRPSDSTRF